MRSRSYTPSPPRGYVRRGRSPPPRGGGRYGREAPTSLLVRNLRHDCRPDDLKRPFSHFGPVKDIYLPRDYYTGNPRGFGFVQFVDPADAADAKHEMDGQVFQGRELTVVFAEENRKKPTEMKMRERGGRDHVYDRRRSPRRYSRSPSPLPRHSRDYYSPPKRRYSRSVSPRDRRYSRERSFSRSPSRGHSPDAPKAERLPYGSRSRTPQSPVRSPSRGRSRSPYPEEDDYSREKHRTRRDDRSPY